MRHGRVSVCAGLRHEESRCRFHKGASKTAGTCEHHQYRHPRTPAGESRDHLLLPGIANNVLSRQQEQSVNQPPQQTVSNTQISARRRFPGSEPSPRPPVQMQGHAHIGDAHVSVENDGNGA